jgi:hypothetical protein
MSAAVPRTGCACWLAPDLLVALVQRPSELPDAGLAAFDAPPEVAVQRAGRVAPLRSRGLALQGPAADSWLLTVDGFAGELDDLRLRSGGERVALLTAPARAAIVAPGELGAALAGLDDDVRAAALSFLLAAPGAHGMVLSQETAGHFAALREVLRAALPMTALAPDAACVMRLERVGAIDDRAFWLSGWIHDPAPEQAALTVITPEGERIEPTAAQMSFHSRTDVEGAFPDSDLPNAGFHAYVELEHPSRHPVGWLVELRTVDGLAVQDVARNPVEHDPEKLHHRVLDPLRVPAPEDRILAGSVAPALERMRAAAHLRIEEVLDYGEVPERPETTVLIATARADLIVHQLLGLSGAAPGVAQAVELLFVCPPGIAAAVRRQAPELCDLYRIPFRVAFLSDRCGLASALNLGAGFARGRLLVLLRDDVFAPSPQWLLQLREIHERTSAAVVGPKLVFEDGAIAHVGATHLRGLGEVHWEAEFAMRGLAAGLPGARDARRVQVLPEGCVMIETELLRAHGGLCESYLDGGDAVADLCLSLAREGLETWCAASVQLTFLDHGGWPMRASPATRRFNDWLLDRRFADQLAAAAPLTASAPAAVAISPEPWASPAADDDGPPVTITRVWRPDSDPEWLHDAALTQPGGDEALDAYASTYSLAVEGWAVGDGPGRLTVEVLCGEEVLAATPVSIPRQDVARRLPDLPGAQAAGFATVIGTIGLPAQFTLEVHAVRDDGERTLLGSVAARRRPLRGRSRGRMSPLLLTTLGRTGSSWLELLVAMHPEIVACRPFIHDARLTSYWTQVLRTLAEPSSYLQVLRPELYPGLWWTGEHRPGRLPLRMAETHMASWLGTEGVRSAAAFCQSRIEEFYSELARVEHRPAARYFAEKCWPDEFTPAIVAELYPDAREILLVRDFRDMVCSIVGFNAKRGTASFGRESAGSDEEFIANLRGNALQMRAAWKARGDRAHLMRYEDLILAPEATLAQAFAYLGVAADPATIAAVLAAAAAELPDAQRDHRTAGSPAESIGRWRRELSPEHRELCRDAFEDVLQSFGYEPTETEAGPVPSAVS